MSLEKPKLVNYSFAVKEGIDVPSGASIPAKINGVETTINISIVEGDAVKSAPAVDDGRVGELESALNDANDRVKDLEKANEKLQKEYEKLLKKKGRK